MYKVTLLKNDKITIKNVDGKTIKLNKKGDNFIYLDKVLSKHIKNLKKLGFVLIEKVSRLKVDLESHKNIKNVEKLKTKSVKYIEPKPVILKPKKEETSKKTSGNSTKKTTRKSTTSSTRKTTTVKTTKKDKTE